jgi:hypothetical protein
MEGTREAAARVLLDRGFRVTIKDAPALSRLFRLNRLRVRPLKAGTIVELSRVIDAGGLDMVDEAGARVHARDVCLLVATAMLNSRWRVRWLARRLACWLYWRVPYPAVVLVHDRLVEINRVVDFTTITAFYRHRAMTMMNPGRAGQAASGSHEATRVASIARGES